jgi:hypothetical protein
MGNERVTSIQGWTARVVLALAVTGNLGCERPARPAPAATEAARTPPGPRSGTARMADTLAVIYAQSVANPESNPFLNRERAGAVQAMIVRQTGAAAWNNRHRLAEERLKAGQTREAIAELEGLMRDAGLSANGGVTATSITPKKKPVFDLLAIAYLRLGEQENCLDNLATSVCILPLKGGGRHTHQEGARAAIARYTEILRHFPDDRASQWLLNIAYLAVGGYPDSIPKRYRIPNLGPRPGDTFPRFPNIAGNVGLAVTGLAGGLSIEDFDHDGLLDVFTTSTSRCISSWPTARAATSMPPRSQGSMAFSAATTLLQPTMTTTATPTSWCCAGAGWARPASIRSRFFADMATGLSRT